MGESGHAPIVLLADRRVTSTSASDTGEALVDVRQAGLCVSSRQADSSGAFAHVRAGVRDRLLRAGEALPAGVRLMFIEGYRPLALQQRYFDGYLDALRSVYPDRDHASLRHLASRYVSPPEVAPHTAGAALATALVVAGFVNYPTEWWHWSYGDRYWAMITGAATASYGPAELP